MTITQLQTIFPQEDITPDTTIGQVIDLADQLSLEDSRIVEWDQVDAWLETLPRTAMYMSIEHYLTEE